MTYDHPMWHEEYEAGPIPEWVHVWSWARARGEMRPFPEQDYWAGAQVMSMAEYERLADDWRAAGSPRVPREPLQDVEAA